MDETTPVPRHLVRRLWLAVVGTAVFLLVSTIHGFFVPGFDAWHQSVSALALAPHGWIQVLNFAVLGCAVLWTVPAWGRVLRGGLGARSYPILTMALGLSLVSAGCLPQDPAPGYDPAGLELEAPTLVGLLHLGVAAVAALSSISLMFIVASRLSGDQQWQGWGTYTRVMATLVIACVAVYGIWSTSPSGLAGTFERASILIPAIWAATFLRTLWKGRPFMKRSTASAAAEIG
jgi:hypothetical protein